MGSLEKTVKAATCSERSARLSSSSPSARPPLNPSTTCRSSSSSPTPPTTWRCSGELPSSRPSLPELSRDLAASVVTEPPAARRTEMADLEMETTMVVTTPPPPHTPLLPPPLPPPLLHLHQKLQFFPCGIIYFLPLPPEDVLPVYPPC